MAIYKEIQLQSELFSLPVDIKLNAEDWYVRIGAPLHQVVQIRPHLFQPWLTTVNNLYGSSLFNLQADRKDANSWTVWEGRERKAEIVLKNNHFLLQEFEEDHCFGFEVSTTESLSRQELLMLAAAIMDTWQRTMKSIAKANLTLA
jgi:hypothetical protein